MNRSEVEQRVQKTFNAVAEAYDTPIMSWFDRTADAIARQAQLTAGKQALDLATGTGKVALKLAHSAPGAQVTGVDLSPGMLAQAITKAEADGLTNTRFIEGSFNELKFGGKFDVVTCSFGLFFVEDMAKTLRLFAGQAKPQGKVIVSTFEAASFAPFNESFMRLYGALGFEVRPAPWLRIAAHESFAQVFQEAGLPKPQMRTHDFGFELTSKEIWWDVIWNAGYRGMLDAMSEEQLITFKQQHLAEVEDVIKNKGSRLVVNVIVAVARKGQSLL
jgi:ubiquinone/menaquinone biosynthesis C-methylase UbiE